MVEIRSLTTMQMIFNLMVEIRSLTTMHMILMVGYLMVEYLIFFTISIWIIDYNAHDFNPNNWIHGLKV